MVLVTDKTGLKEAVKNLEQEIIVTGKFAKMLKPFTYKRKKSVNINPTDTHYMAAGAIASSFVGLSVSVALTLIITLGIVTIIAIFRDYDVEYSSDKLSLKRK